MSLHTFADEEITPLLAGAGGSGGGAGGPFGNRSKNKKNVDDSSTNAGAGSSSKMRLDGMTSAALQRSLGLQKLVGIRGVWFPGAWDLRDVVTASVPPARYKTRGVAAVPTTTRVREYRTLRRRLFLILTEPDTSISSGIFFVILIAAIVIMNGLMMLQTMHWFQYTPTDCLYCGGETPHLFDDDTTPDRQQQIEQNYWNTNKLPPCVCPPTPYPWTDFVLRYLIYFFSVEWILRVLCFSPAPHQRATSLPGRFGQWIEYLFGWQQVLDFWATFPYYMEFLNNSNGLMSLRLLRLFRVFQLVRLGSYNATFTTLITVLGQATLHLKILGLILLFGAALFGSLVFWLEKGTWQYWEPTKQYEFVRINEHGDLEVSPFTSIPATFYWFMVTATTVGYGDVYPTTVAGRWVAIFAMLTGVLVIAFPVGVFSDLWSKELEKQQAMQDFENAGSTMDDDDVDTQQDTTTTTTTGIEDNQDTTGTSSGGAALIMVSDDHDDSLVTTTMAPPPHAGGVGLNPYSAHRIHPVTGSASQNWNYGYQHAPQVLEATSILPENVRPDQIMWMQKSDWADILMQLQQMEHAQTHIRSILKKYRVPKKNTTNNNSNNGSVWE